MKLFAPAALAVLGGLSGARAAHSRTREEVSPISKILELITDLQAKVIKEGEASQKVYEEFSEWCEEENKNYGFEIKTGKAEVKELTAIIDEETAVIESLTTKTEELAGKIKVDEQDLKAATEIREAEAADFAAEKKELDDTIDVLNRAIGILEKQAGGALLQTTSAMSLTKALGAMVQASAFSSDDAARLTALVQESEDDQDDQPEAGAPAADTYESHSGGIIKTLEGLLESAETQLGNARNKESKALFEFQQLKQSIEDAIEYAKKELDEAKEGISAAGEKKAKAEGELEVTTKDLNEDTKALGDLHLDCMTKAQEFEAETNSRGEELKALAEAKKVIQETTAGAALDQVDFVQVQMEDGANFEVVRFIRKLSKKNKAPALAQLAKRMATIMHDTARSQDDIFAKIKGLIAEMIEKLEKEGDADAKHKAYCDKELKYADEKKAKRVGEIEKLATAIDEQSSRSAQLKDETATLQDDLNKIARSQATMDKLREAEKEDFEGEKAELELGISGVKKAIKILKEYYAKDSDHASGDGAASSIIGLIEVALSDFEKQLAEITGEEESAVAEYEKVTNENEILSAEKEQAVKFKVKESKELDKATAEAESDKEATEEQLKAVETELEKLHEECDETAPTYEELQKGRQNEIAGLKQALDILEGEAALIQESASHTVRRLRLHAA